MGIIKTKKNTDDGVKEKISTSSDIHVSIPSQNIDIQNNPDTSIKDGSIPILKPIATMAVDPTQGRLLVQADNLGRKLYDLGPITGDEEFKRHIHYLEFVVKSDEIIKASDPNNYNEKFKILISSEIKNLKEKYIQTDGYCNIEDFQTVTGNGDLDHAFALEFDNSTTRKLNIKSYLNTSLPESYTIDNLTTWGNCNTANNEYNIISVIMNPAFNAGEYTGYDDTIGIQVLINHVLVTYGYNTNGKTNDYISIPYIENPHIYILFEAEQLTDGSAIGKSYRTTIELNTNFDRFLYKDIALQCYRNDMVDTNPEGDPPNNYWTYCQNYNWYPHRNINSIFPNRVEDLEYYKNDDIYTVIDNRMYKTMNMTSHLSFFNPTLDDNNILQIELISKSNPSSLDYIFIGTTRVGVPDWFINGDYSDYTKYSQYNTWYVPSFEDIFGLYSVNYDAGTKYFGDKTLVFNKGFFILFVKDVTASNNITTVIVKLDSDGSCTKIFEDPFNPSSGYTSSTNVLNYMQLDFNTKTFSYCIVMFDNINNISNQPVSFNNKTDTGLLDFPELWDTIVDTNSEDTTLPYYTFIVHNSTYPKSSYLNLGDRHFYASDITSIQNLVAITTSDTSKTFQYPIKQRHVSNNNWKSLIPYLTKKEIKFKYGTQDQPVILPYNLSTSENDSIFLTMTFPTSLTYNVRYWVVVGNGIGYSGTDQGQGITNLMNGIIISVDCSKTSGNFYYMAFKDGEQVGNMSGLTLDDGGVSVSYRSCLFRDTVSGETKIMLHGSEVGSDSTLFNELNTIAVHAEYVGSDTLSVGDDMGYVIINTNPDDYTTNYEELANQLLANDSGGGGIRPEPNIIDDISIDDQTLLSYKYSDNYDDEYTEPITYNMRKTINKHDISGTGNWEGEVE